MTHSLVEGHPLDAFFYYDYDMQAGLPGDIYQCLVQKEWQVLFVSMVPKELGDQDDGEDVLFAELVLTGDDGWREAPFMKWKNRI